MVETVKMTKILMDGGSNINILYIDAFDRLMIDNRRLHASQAPIHGIVLGRQVTPLSTVALRVMFSKAVHYRKEVLTFEVVDFEGSYHAIFGSPSYVKFMATSQTTPISR
jgi:hypothetical protein